jgi:GMP synthase-like glutamine amidotransferase
MRVHYLQHVSFEGMGSIGEWAALRGHVLTGAEVFQAARSGPPGMAGPVVPRQADLDRLDLLVVMGGPMNVYQEAEYLWLAAEKVFIAAAIGAGKPVLGICLGAQLIAAALGGTVSKGPQPEIGWYPVELTPEGRGLPLFAAFPIRFTALHWHGDTFSIPPGATHVASSAACANQAFAYDGGRVVGLQFHLEETRESLAHLIDNARAELVPGDWIATPDELLAPEAPFRPCRELLFSLLDSMTMG